jgi:hypothetical protein
MNKERAKEYLIKSKLYRFLALVFACMACCSSVTPFSSNPKAATS